MGEYSIGPGRLGLVVETEGVNVTRFVEDVYNGFPVHGARENEGTKLVIQIEERNADGEAGFSKGGRTGKVGGLEYRFNGRRAEIISPAVSANIDFGRGEGCVAVKNIQSPDLDTLLRQIVFYLAAGAGYVTLHSVCWVLDGRAYVSCGPAESGKSTIAGMLENDIRVLSDEFNFVGGAREPRVLRSPVRAAAPATSPDENYPLAAIAFHKKNERPYVRPLGPAEGLRGLEKNVFVGAFATDASRVEAFGLIADLSINVPLFEAGVAINKKELLSIVEEIGGFSYEPEKTL